MADFERLVAAIRLETMIHNNREKMLAKMEPNQDRMEAKMETNQDKMDAMIDTNQEKMEAKIQANNEKFEALQGSLASRMDIHQARREAMQEKSDTNGKEMKVGQEHLKEEIMAGLKTQIGCLASRTEVNQEKVKA
jgi:acetolactate synthase small subunit